jgi:two-component system, OmpR family, sensor kinase
VTIRLRLTLLIVAIALVLLAGGGILFVTQLNQDLQSSLDATLGSRADAIASQVPTKGSDLDVQLQLRSENGIYAQLLTTDGLVLDSSRALLGTSVLTAGEAATASHHGLAFDRVLPVRVLGDTGGESVRIVAEATPRRGVVVAVATSRDLIDKAGGRVTGRLIAAGVIVLLLVGPGSWLLVSAALRPVERMRREVADLAGAPDEARVAVPRTRDELSRLADTFNGLLGRLRAALVRERAFVADAGHELRTPLTVLKGEFELAQRPGRTREELLTTVGIAAGETDRLVRLTENLLGLAREGPGRQRPFDLADVAREAVTAAGSSAAARGVRLVVQDEAGGVVSGEAERLRQAIDNLLSNAVRYAAPGTAVTVRLAREGSDAVIEVTDEGTGFPAEFLPLAFDRFARADDARNRAEGGNGLGLAVVAAVMAAHGGTAAAANRADRGAILTLRWPQPDASDPREG